MVVEACEGSDKAAAKQQLLLRSRSSRTPGRRRRWRSSSMDMDTEEANVDYTGGDDDGVREPLQPRRGGGGEGGEQRRPGAGARLARKIKEQRARFYIVRRCVSMLVCWHDDA